MLSAEELDELGNFLAARLAPPELPGEEPQPGRWCDHTLTLTEHWLHQRGILNARPILRELKRRGGHCDCEVLLNVVLRD
jgi:hypothetical protein